MVKIVEGVVLFDNLFPRKERFFLRDKSGLREAWTWRVPGRGILADRRWSHRPRRLAGQEQCTGNALQCRERRRNAPARGNCHVVAIMVIFAGRVTPAFPWYSYRVYSVFLLSGMPCLALAVDLPPSPPYFRCITLSFQPNGGSISISRRHEC